VAKRPEPSEPTVKTLFAHSSNICGFSDLERGEYCEQRLTDPKWRKVRARICHIRGLLPTSARYDPAMTEHERNAYENLLLLCPNHHTLIDDLEPDRYTVAVLDQMKGRAERHASPPTWSSDSEFAFMARSALAVMRQIWWGHRELPVVRAKQLVAGSLIAYEGHLVRISEVARRPDGHSVHLIFAEPVALEAGTVTSWDLDDEDPVNIRYGGGARDIAAP
jgi:hypothetical protein